jgi:hypothetical protein
MWITWLFCPTTKQNVRDDPRQSPRCQAWRRSPHIEEASQRATAAAGPQFLCSGSPRNCAL